MCKELGICVRKKDVFFMDKNVLKRGGKWDILVKKFHIETSIFEHKIETCSRLW